MITYEAADGTIVMLAEEFTTADVEAAMLASASPKGVAELRAHFLAAKVAEAFMNERATAVQRAITFGDCVTRIWAHPEHGDDVLIFGTVLPLALIARDEREHGATADEVTDLCARLVEGYGRGWRYGRWHSEDVPEGEYGAAHVADLHPVTADEFDAAQFRGWTA